MSKLTTLFGPPGTGKTTTLSRWAKSAAERHGGENIMICSLTRTAATEIASRDTDVPDHNVGTLHAHAYRSIEDDGPRVMGKEAIDEFNALYPQWAIPQTKVDDDQTTASFGSSHLGQYDLLRARCVDRRLYPDFLASFVEAYELFKTSHNVIDFTDMIQYAVDHVECPAKYIIMDEAQDCSALEFKLLQKWAAQSEGCVIAGDDDQAAYEWRGASVDAFLNFSEDQRVLGQSYRLPAKVKARADAWIRQISKRKEKEYNPRDGSQGVAVELEYRKPEDVISHMMSQPGTSMILTTCGYQTLPFVYELKCQAVPFCNPYRMKGDFASTWNPLRSGGREMTSSSDSVRAFLSPPWTWRSARMWMKDMTGLQRGAKKLLDSEKNNQDLIPIESLSAILPEGGLQKALTGDAAWWLSQLKSDPKKRSQIALRLRFVQRFGKDSLTSTPKIIVGTIHSVKGGQADNVYLLPDLSQQGKEAWSNGLQDPIIRQMYIGMTRARERLFLLRPPRGSCLTW